MPLNITRTALAAALAGAIGIAAYVRIESLWSSNRTKRYVQSWRDFMAELREQRTCYVYEALGQPENKTIRLMELLPGIDFTPRLTARAVRSHHCWGDPADSLPVSCNDGSYLWITPGLLGALRQMRYKDRPRVLWADAICVNQADNHEKNWQVAQMGEIYRGAERVLIWLGHEEGLSQEMPAFISQLLEAKELMSAANDQKCYLALSAEEIATYDIPPYFANIDFYYALHFLTERPWFQRVWIVQELCQAKEALVYCGTWCIPWERLSQAYLFMVYELQLEEYIDATWGRTSMPCLVDLTCTKSEISSGDPLPILKILIRHDNAKATDPRDRLFGLAGIACDRTDIDIDYGKSVNEVYYDFALRSIHAGNFFDVLNLSACRIRAVLQPGMPSWVPDCGATAFAESICLASTLFMQPQGYAYDATNGTVCQLSVSSSGSLIQIRGLELDSITLVGSTRSPNNVCPPVWNTEKFEPLWTMMEWARLCGANSDKRYDLTGETMHQVFWHTLLLGTERHGWDPELQETIEKWETSFKAIRLASNVLKPEIKGLGRILMTLLLFSIKSWAFPLVLRQKVNLDEKMDRFIRFIGWINAGRTFIMTEKGWIGVVTGQVAMGDVVVLLEGGKVPYILRRKVDENVFEFVGDCYLHGHMDGQSWNLDRCHMINLA